MMHVKAISRTATPALVARSIHSRKPTRALQGRHTTLPPITIIGRYFILVSFPVERFKMQL